MSLLEEQLEEIRKRTAAVGVTPEMAQVAAAQPEPVTQDSLLPVPMSPIEKMMERDGKFKTMGKMLLGGFTGMTPFLMPELIGGKARYEQELKDYSAQQKLLQAQKMAEEYQGMLFDDDPSNDIEALQKGAIYQPDIYEPVLRDRLQRRLNPTEETMFASEYQINPETGNWARYQTGNQGTTTMADMGPDFTPASRMWSPDAREKAIGEVDDRVQQSSQHISELSTLGEELDSVKDEWTAGMQGKLGEEWKELTGAQDKVTAVRTQYRRIRNSLAVQNLPPGVASDKDIAMVLEGFPSDFTNYEEMRKYISAMERAERKIRAYYQYESNWLSTKKTRTGMAKAWQEDQKSIFDGAVGEKPSGDDEFDALWNGNKR